MAVNVNKFGAFSTIFAGERRAGSVQFSLVFWGNNCTKTLIYATVGHILSKSGIGGLGYVFENRSSVIVPRFSGQQLQKNADFCNCRPFFEQTITDETLWMASLTPIKMAFATS